MTTLSEIFNNTNCLYLFIFSIICFLIGFKVGCLFLYKLSVSQSNQTQSNSKTSDNQSIVSKARIDISFSEELLHIFNHDFMLKEINLRCDALIKKFGIDIPTISHLGMNPNIRKNFFTINIEGIPVTETELKTDMLIVNSSPEILQIADIPHEIIAHNLGLEKKIYVPIEYEKKIKDMNIVYLTPENAVLEQVSICMRSNLPQFMSMQETQEWINNASSNHPVLITEIHHVISLPKLTEVFKRLLTDQISLAARRPLLEAIAKWAELEEEPAMLAELIRTSMGRYICFSYADTNKNIVAAIFDPSVEEVIRQSVRRTNLGDLLALEPAMADKVMEHIKNIVSEPRFMNPMPVILCSIDIRRFVRSYLLKLGIDIPVLSHQDIAEDFTVQVIYAIK